MRWLLLSILLLLMNLASAESRYALLIANQNYPTPQKDLNIFGALETPVSEMRELSKVLQDYDFTVTEVKDADLDEMSSAINRFVSKLQPGDVGLFYYAGHGVQAYGNNYLIPVQKKFADATDVKNGAYLAQSAIDKLSGSSALVKLVFLDSCRNQLLKEKGRGFSDPGFAKMDAKGIVISYATGLGEIAADNITYTSQLVKAIQSHANQPIEVVLSEAQELTAQATGGQQMPWYEKRMVGKFCFGVCVQQESRENGLLKQQKIMQLSDVTSPSNSENKPKNLWLNPNTNTFVVIEPQQDTFTETPPSTTASTADAASGSDAAIVKILSELLAVDALKQQKEDVQPPTVDAPATPQLGKSFRDELKDGSLGPEVVWIPGGTFQMGSNEYDSEKPVHTVTVKSFGMGKYEVTRGEFRKFVEATNYRTDAEKERGCYEWTGYEFKKNSSYHWKNVGFVQDDSHPVVCVSWNDAKTYVKWLSEQTGQNYLLPSEAQWEYAVRSGSITKYFWGNEVKKACRYANIADQKAKGQFINLKDTVDCNDGYVFTSPVGKFEVNQFGLHDMTGNVWEWVEDIWHGNYEGAPVDGSAWMNGGDSSKHLLRGGSWSSDDNWLRCAYRLRNYTAGGYNLRGFRISRVNL